MPEKSGWRSKALVPLAVGAGVVVGLLSMLPLPAPVSARGKHSTPPSAHAVTMGFETKDISARATVKILASMAAVTALVIGIVVTMVWRFDVSRKADFASIPREQTIQTAPPQPRLQTDPFDDLAREQAREQGRISTYAWASQDHTIARIPIGRAMALVVGHSLDPTP
jgi:hypothetical protein